MESIRVTRREALAAAAGAALASAPLAAHAQEASAPAALAHFGFTKLQCADLEKCAAFYTRAAGLVEQTRLAPAGLADAEEWQPEERRVARALRLRPPA